MVSLPQITSLLSSSFTDWYIHVGNSSSRDGDWLEDEIEGMEAPKNGLTNTTSEVYALMKGKRGPMPDRHFYQTKLQDQVTSTSPTFESSTVGKTKSEAFEYFGYLQINGKWVDPDSEKATHEALNNHPDVTNPLLPGMDSSSGPYILSQSEQSIVYNQFVDDEDDNEGDPRAFRISPETFAMLAEGAVKGQQPQHEVIKQPVSKPQAKKYNALVVHEYAFKYSRNFKRFQGLTFFAQDSGSKGSSPEEQRACQVDGFYSTILRWNGRVHVSRLLYWWRSHSFVVTSK